MNRNLSLRGKRPSEDCRFSDMALERMARESLLAGPNETGGALFGLVDSGPGRTTIRVERATGPGRGFEAHPTAFAPDMDHFRDRERYYRTKGFQYLGEWHKHPGDCDWLSPVDRAMVSQILREEERDWILLPLVTLVGGSIRITSHRASWDEDSDSVKLERMGCLELPRREWEHRTAPARLYVSRDWLESFRRDKQDRQDHCGAGDGRTSWVFLPLPEPGRTLLTLSRGEAPCPLKEADHVVGFLNPDDTFRFFSLKEGEAEPLEPCVVDPREDVYSRNAGLLETRVLKDRSVGIVGLGSVGSTLALELARAGVGHLSLHDPDTLEPHNLCRHQASLRDLGRPKVEAVADRIREICPTLEVETFVEDVVADPEAMERTEERLSCCDLLVCTTDTDDSRRFVNRLGRSRRIPTLQVGLHERARSGIVQRVFPDGPCFECHRDKVLLEGEKRGDVAYSAASDPRQIAVQPGLAAQINWVAEAGVLAALRILTGDGTREDGFPDLLLCLLGEPQNPSGYPHMVALTLEPVEECEGCGTPSEDSSRGPSQDEEEKDPYPDPSQIPTFEDTAVWLKGLGAREDQDEVDLDVDVEED